jgi:hypothetical protein
MNAQFTAIYENENPKFFVKRVNALSRDYYTVHFFPHNAPDAFSSIYQEFARH